MHVAGSALLGRKKLPILDKLSRISFEGSLLSRAYLQNQSLKHFVCSHWTRTAWREKKKRKLVLLEDDASAGQFSSFFKIDDTTQDIAYMCDPAVLIDQALFGNLHLMH